MTKTCIIENLKQTTTTKNNNKGWVTQKEYKEVVRMCREKIRKAKAQLELNLATGAKKDQEILYKHISSKRRTKENLYSLLDEAGNVTTEDKEKAEVLNAFFNLSLKVRPVILRVLHSLTW